MLIDVLHGGSKFRVIKHNHEVCHQLMFPLVRHFVSSCEYAGSLLLVNDVQ
jgi:hypothetical protein